MIQVGITGGIGSGKSTICKIFESLGSPIFYADKVAKEITSNNKNIQSKIIELLGEEAFSNGTYNTKYVSKLVFENRDLLYKLNQIIHPEVQNAYKNWLIVNNQKPYVLKEAAILIETQTHKELDKIILVSANKDLRIERILKRDNTSKEAVLARMDKQLSDHVKRNFAHFEIENNEQQPLIPTVIKIHEKLIEYNNSNM